jgi:hypothetical protein
MFIICLYHLLNWYYFVFLFIIICFTTYCCKNKKYVNTQFSKGHISRCALFLLSGDITTIWITIPVPNYKWITMQRNWGRKCAPTQPMVVFNLSLHFILPECIQIVRCIFSRGILSQAVTLLGAAYLRHMANCILDKAIVSLFLIPFLLFSSTILVWAVPWHHVLGMEGCPPRKRQGTSLSYCLLLNTWYDGNLDTKRADLGDYRVIEPQLLDVFICDKNVIYWLWIQGIMTVQYNSWCPDGVSVSCIVWLYKILRIEKEINFEGIFS